MTLHWWMHWFWVTTLLTILWSCQITAAPQSEELQHLTTDVEIEPGDRQGRAMYFTKTMSTAKPFNVTANQTDELIQPIQNVTNATTATTTPVVPLNATDNKNVTETVTAPNVTVSNTTTAPELTNLTDSQNATFASKRRNLTRPDVVKADTIERTSESRIVTDKPLSLETQNFLQTRIPPNVESSRRVIEQEGGMDTGAIAGISFAALVLGALAGSTAFVLYRRRYLNKPQTLNDKCSNPDSSGYLDDSTIRDNSEEMYSLDNDSFLNSLEAMTIQNYWTDTVKHTKL
ncbi:uncharacterized protein LOC134663079 [Cydia amplana]|uniref:uncharacterized protein LOC134663079 n=1 Tax=Cydia amplana TaxID=1869771 RepID=UPI002FE6351A